MIRWCRSRSKQRKAGEALRHPAERDRMALPNAANLNLVRIPRGTGLKSPATVLLVPARASGHASGTRRLAAGDFKLRHLLILFRNWYYAAL